MDILKIKQKKSQQKITMLTAYDYSIAQIIDSAGIDIILVGDSLGMVFKGEQNTLNVSLEQMIYHTSVVSRAVKNSLLVADMPFLSYQAGINQAVINAGKLIQAGAQAVKLEGAHELKAVEKMLQSGIPVMGHLGFTPQSVNQFSGYRVQGKDEAQAISIKKQAQALQSAGVFALVLEMVPAALAEQITAELEIPVIGIGAGVNTDGQVLVINDVLGLSPKVPKFAREYLDLKQMVSKAVLEYKKEVIEQKFPE